MHVSACYDNLLDPILHPQRVLTHSETILLHSDCFVSDQIRCVCHLCLPNDIERLLLQILTLLAEFKWRWDQPNRTVYERQQPNFRKRSAYRTVVQYGCQQSTSNDSVLHTCTWNFDFVRIYVPLLATATCILSSLSKRHAQKFVHSERWPNNLPNHVHFPRKFFGTIWAVCWKRTFCWRNKSSLYDRWSRSSHDCYRDDHLLPMQIVKYNVVSIWSSTRQVNNYSCCGVECG